MKKVTWSSFLIVILAINFFGCAKKEVPKQALKPASFELFSFLSFSSLVLSPCAHEDIVVPPPPPVIYDGKVTTHVTHQNEDVANELALTIKYKDWRKSRFQLKVCPFSTKYFTFQEPDLPVTKHVYNDLIKDLIPQPNGEFIVKPIHGKQFRAKWVESHRDCSLWRYPEAHHATIEYFRNYESEKEFWIDLDQVASFQFDWKLVPKHPTRGDSSQEFVTLVLRDNSLFQINQGRVDDCCGHSGSPSWHGRPLQGADWILHVKDNDSEGEENCRLIKGALISEIEFTGNFSKSWGGCREIILRFCDGSSQKTNLYLTGESYEGVCHASNTSFQAYDSVVGATDYGEVEIQLNNVKKIIFKH